jgi:hypothetical protein
MFLYFFNIFFVNKMCYVSKDFEFEEQSRKVNRNNIQQERTEYAKSKRQRTGNGARGNGVAFRSEQSSDNLHRLQSKREF